MEKPSLPSGTRDFSPKVMLRRKYITSVMERIFLSHGFGALETPSLENLRTLQGKYGNEGDQLLFKVLNSGDFLSKADASLLSAKDSKGLTPQISDRGLRYDLTVPLARFVVMNRNEIVFPFKRYQMQPVWRADRPQKGRYREFWQCDIDVVGANSVVSEAELVEMYQEVFAELDLGVKIRINHRGILDAFMGVLGTRENWNAFMIIIDKADKIGFEGVAKELEEKGLSMSLGAWKWLWDSKSVSGNSLKMDLIKGTEFLQGDALLKGMNELETIFGLLADAGNVELDFTLARGLSYYTGAVFEVEATDGRLPADFRLGSIGGGGRYDGLVEELGGPATAGIGFALGLDRTLLACDAENVFPAPNTDVFAFVVDTTGGHEAALVCNQLRMARIGADRAFDNRSMKAQMKAADRSGAQVAIIIGSNELEAGQAVIRPMNSGEQYSVNRADLLDAIQNEVSKFHSAN